MSSINTPLVSVIIITYNSSRYVLETLESIKSQSWKYIELIISDDASKDNTVQLCRDWIKENRERFVESKIITVEMNTGISANCNRGLQATTGEWIKLIAGDDVLMDNCIADNLEYVRRFPEASFIVSDMTEIDENSVPIYKKNINEGLAFLMSKSTTEEQLKAYSRWPEFLNTPTFFYRRELLNVIGYCNEKFKIYEDMVMIFKIIGAKVKIHYVNKPTVQYRIHANSASRNKSIDEIREREALDIFRMYQKKNLNVFNLIDLSVYYENWLRFKYKGLYKLKGISYLRKLSLFYWYLKLHGVKNY